MAEYIEREALKQSIRIMPRTTHPELVLYSSVQKVISDVPTADVVEVVRCEECKHSRQPREVTCFCTRFEDHVLLSDFCSYGEKRSEGK